MLMGNFFPQQKIFNRLMLSLLSWQKAIYYLAQVIYYQDDNLALAALPKVKYISACSQQNIKKIFSNKYCLNLGHENMIFPYQGTTQLMIAEIESKTVFTLVFGKQTTTWTIKTRIRSLLQRVIIFWLLLAVFLDDNHDSNFLQLMLKAWQLQISLFIYYSSSQQSSHQNGVLCLSSIGVSGYLFFFVNNKT